MTFYATNEDGGPLTQTDMVSATQPMSQTAIESFSLNLGECEIYRVEKVKFHSFLFTNSPRTLVKNMTFYTNFRYTLSWQNSPFSTDAHPRVGTASSIFLKVAKKIHILILFDFVNLCHMRTNALFNIVRLCCFHFHCISGII